MLTEPSDLTPPTFAAVQVADVPPTAVLVAPSSTAATSTQALSCGRIEIELAGGRRLRVGHDVDVDVLRRIINALEILS